MFRLARENNQNCMSPQFVRNAYLFKTAGQETTAGVIKMGLHRRNVNEVVSAYMPLRRGYNGHKDHQVDCWVSLIKSIGRSDKDDQDPSADGISAGL